MLKLAKLDGKPEIFYSIQGEGISIGVPSIFVRTSLCNLHCIWCDTDYTWNWVGTPFAHAFDEMPGYQKFEKKDWIERVSIEEAVQKVTAFPCKNVILTGGEPMMQQDGLLALMQQLRKKDDEYRFEIETNGTLVPKPGFDAAIHQYNVSPKLSNSLNPQKLREKPKAYRFFAENPKSNFKFVVAENADLQEIMDLIGRYAIPSNKILLMPEGNNPQRLTDRRVWLVEVCKQYNFRFSDRLHVHIWGSKKGV